MQYKFPDGFLWGAATSAHQVEGNSQGSLLDLYEKQGLRVSVRDLRMDTENDWKEWERKNAERLAKEATGKFGHLPNWKDIAVEATFPNNYISGIGTNHYNRYKEDFALAKEFGHNTARFSIEWSRIEPSEGEFDQNAIDHYADVVKTCRELGLEPFVTLWHWPIPIWLRNKGGLQNKKLAEYFSRYVKKIVPVLKNDVKFWTTLNEPGIVALNSYYLGIWPPQEKGVLNYFNATSNLILAHKTGYEIIKQIDPGAQIGISTFQVYFEAERNRLVNIVLKKIADWWWNFYFLNKIKNHQDFIGLNHYFHNRINYGFNKNENKIISDLGWELYPEAIYRCLKDLARYKKPIYITENGLADAKDEKRPSFIKETLINIHRAIKEGVDIRGYLHWSLMDNFEWDKGYWPRFGLIEVNRQTLERKPRPSAYVYKKIIEDNGIIE